MTSPAHIQALEIQTAVLRQIAECKPLAPTLETICSLIEDACGGICSVLLLARGARSLGPAIGPSLSQSARQALDSLPLSNRSGSCGNAAFTGVLTIVEDTATDARWSSARLQEFAETFGIRACWSSPLLSPGRQVLGTFAISHHECKKPTEDELSLLDTASLLASLAIERHREAERARQQTALLLQHERLAAMGQLASGVVHEFNNQLGVITSFVYYLQESLPPDDLRRDDLSEILGAATKSTHLTGQLLAFCRAQPLQVSRFDLCTLMDKLGLILPELLGGEVEVVLDRGPPGCMVEADVEQLVQVVVQLAQDAVDRVDGAGRLEVTSREIPRRDGPRGLVCLSYGDTMGVITGELALFEPFKDGVSVAGMRLASCHGSITQQGGTLKLSQSSDGASYMITFPVLPRPQSASGSANIEG